MISFLEWSAIVSVAWPEPAILDDRPFASFSRHIERNEDRGSRAVGDGRTIEQAYRIRHHRGVEHLFQRHLERILRVRVRGTVFVILDRDLRHLLARRSVFPT